MIQAFPMLIPQECVAGVDRNGRENPAAIQRCSGQGAHSRVLRRNHLTIEADNVVHGFDYR